MKILYVTTIGATMDFFPEFIHHLLSNGHTVAVATNEKEWQVSDCYRTWGCRIYPLSCLRSPLKKGNLDAVKQIRDIVSADHYDIVHCHTPIAAMCTRIACRRARKNGTKVIYTAHGFHFFKGAPLKNWLLYYPVEKLCARWTDVLITINKEDYARAQKKFHAKQIAYVPGVGIDVQKFSPDRWTEEERLALRSSLGLEAQDKLVLSVGELNQNKNHEAVIHAIARIGDPHIHYAIAGRGELDQHLLCVAKELGVEKQVHLLGFRDDVICLYQISDLFIHPSLREGLPVSVMEAMASQVPVLCSDIRGNRDLACRDALFDSTDTEMIAQKIKQFLFRDMSDMVDQNYRYVCSLDTKQINAEIQKIYMQEI